MATLVNNFEDTLAGGATFEQAAEKMGQKVHTLEPMTHEGMLSVGKKADLPAYQNFIDVAFTTPEKDHSQAVPMSDGSYFMVHVDSVAPEHVRPLAEVKTQVANTVLANKQQDKLQKIADTVSAQMRGQEGRRGAGGR